MRKLAVALALVLSTGCAAPGSAPDESIPVCGALASLPPLPDPACGEELTDYENALRDRIGDAAGRVLVRIELGDDSRVGAVCVDPGPGYGPDRARRELAEESAALRALPPGPACAAGKRLDLNRYQAMWEKLREREARCSEQTRVTRDTHGPTTVRDRTVPGSYGVYDREYERCMDYQADWIALDQPGSTRPAIWAKPEIPNPPGPDAYETAHRCTRLSRVFEKRAACIEADGWERLNPDR